jgi:hypothetical protein
MGVTSATRCARSRRATTPGCARLGKDDLATLAGLLERLRGAVAPAAPA